MSERLKVLTTGGYADICLRVPESQATQVKALLESLLALLQRRRNPLPSSVFYIGRVINFQSKFRINSSVSEAFKPFPAEPILP
jgi:hypothetical protein